MRKLLYATLIGLAAIGCSEDSKRAAKTDEVRKEISADGYKQRKEAEEYLAGLNYQDMKWRECQRACEMLQNIYTNLEISTDLTTLGGSDDCLEIHIQNILIGKDPYNLLLMLDTCDSGLVINFEDVSRRTHTLAGSYTRNINDFQPFLVGIRGVEYDGMMDHPADRKDKRAEKTAKKGFRRFRKGLNKEYPLLYNVLSAKNTGIQRLVSE
ncbi:hypothetical protein KY345_00400 [Candidatus Woesearchaeota archaeon]|nr:hypothetical protein [Candidatus Woesearchaeota archaeon]